MYGEAHQFCEPYRWTLSHTHDDFEPYGSQSVPYYDKALYYETREEAERVLALLRAEIARMDTDMQALLTVFIRSNDVAVADALETLREIAGYEIRNETVADVRSNPVLAYWQQFPDETLAHYIQKGKDLA